MTNNDILRRLRYTFKFNDAKMIHLFSIGGLQVTREQIINWLKKDDDPSYKSCHDSHMVYFLNGFIVDKRGKNDGNEPEAEKTLTNNLILKKLKIALNLKTEDLLAILSMVNFDLSKNELSAFFRRPGHKHYRECKDQVLRNFLKGLQLKYRSK